MKHFTLLGNHFTICCLSIFHRNASSKIIDCRVVYIATFFSKKLQKFLISSQNQEKRVTFLRGNDEEFYKKNWER